VLFNSVQFLIFFLMVTAAFWAFPHRFRWSLLLLASCYFYMVFVPKYILILFAVILIDYGAGLMIEPAKGRMRRIILGVSLVANVGILAFFKYFNFAEAEVVRLCQWLGISIYASHLNIILPIGLSFHTFQSMSYTIEVYRGAQRAERHFGIYALYVLFYPQMVAGPIERPQNILPQLHAPVSFSVDNLQQGIQLMLWGLFKKSVIADNLTLIVDPAFRDPHAHQGWPLVIALYAFSIQIYCDFSGYSDIARGAARTLGYDLMKNFNLPYLAESISDFWRRWHISLSTWFRDYVYFPLGGNRVGRMRRYLNLLIVFLLSGLWHGASWAFVVWGGLHGMYLIIGQTTQSARDKLWTAVGGNDGRPLRKVVAVLLTFHLVTFSWIPFRMGTLGGTLDFVSALWPVADGTEVLPKTLDHFQRVGLLLGLSFLVAIELTQSRRNVPAVVARWPRLGYAGALTCGGIVILLLGRFSSQDFIYFQF